VTQHRDGGSREGGWTANEMTGRLALSHAPYLLYASAGIPRESRRTERAEAVPRPNCKSGFLQLGREKE